MSVDRLLFVREPGFPRRWSAVQSPDRRAVGMVTQEHERSKQGKSVFRYRATLFPDGDLGVFATLRGAKQALKDALEA
jgi:hypothetical protein